MAFTALIMVLDRPIARRVSILIWEIVSGLNFLRVLLILFVIDLEAEGVGKGKGERMMVCSIS